LSVGRARDDSTALRAWKLRTPTVFADVPLDHKLWRAELFGPVLAVVKARNFDEDAIGDGTVSTASRAPYSAAVRATFNAPRANSASAISTSTAADGRARWTSALRRRSHVGVGSKAGGPDYLLQFVIPRAICESTIRQGSRR